MSLVTPRSADVDAIAGSTEVSSVCACVLRHPGSLLIFTTGDLVSIRAWARGTGDAYSFVSPPAPWLYFVNMFVQVAGLVLSFAFSVVATPIIYDGRASFNLTAADLDSSTGPYLT